MLKVHSITFARPFSLQLSSSSLLSCTLYDRHYFLLGSCFFAVRYVSLTEKNVDLKEPPVLLYLTPLVLNPSAFMHRINLGFLLSRHVDQSQIFLASRIHQTPFA